MELIKSISLVMAILLGAWMIVTAVCQVILLHYVAPQGRPMFRRALRKWDYATARTFVAPEGAHWLRRVETLVQAGAVLLGIAAFIAVGVVIFGPEVASEVPK